LGLAFFGGVPGRLQQVLQDLGVDIGFLFGGLFWFGHGGGDGGFRYL
jgi:hypothetical protein